MAACNHEGRTKKSALTRQRLGNERGIALVVALIMSASIMALTLGVLYFVNQSTEMSGAGKTYKTAQEAADGSINALKDAIDMTIWGNPIAPAFTSPNCLTTAILTDGGSACSASITLPGAFGNYSATVTLQRLYTTTLPGSRLEFSRSAGGTSGTTIYYKITSKVEGPRNTRAENSALYRFAG